MNNKEKTEKQNLCKTCVKRFERHVQEKSILKDIKVVVDEFCLVTKAQIQERFIVFKCNKYEKEGKKI